jgi:hypothetical protein
VEIEDNAFRILGNNPDGSARSNDRSPHFEMNHGQETGGNQKSDQKTRTTVINHQSALPFPLTGLNLSIQGLLPQQKS